MKALKYNVDHTYSTSNTLEVTVSQTGSTAMVRERGQDVATKRTGYRVVANGETIGYGSWNQTERELLIETIKTERYARLAYEELYRDLLSRLASIGLVERSNEDNELDDRL
jgi:hypothetical protein